MTAAGPWTGLRVEEGPSRAFDLDQSPATAVLSDPVPDYRYALTRVWDPHNRATAVFIMLNPSTADAATTDPTLTRCIRFAASWGRGRLLVLNLYGWRSQHPRHLVRMLQEGTGDPVGPVNDAYAACRLAAIPAGEALVVAAWGNNKLATPERTQVMRDLAAARGHRLHCLGVTKDGAPRHPLYVPGSASLVPWPVDPADDGSVKDSNHDEQAEAAG